VWKISGNLQRATWVATTAGRGLGLGLVALGVLGAFAGGTLVGGLWLIFIGWFLTNAAGASYRHLMLTQVLRGVTAYEAMSRHPEVVDPELTLDALIHEHFFKRPYNAFPVTVHGVLVGLVTLSQVKPVPREEWPNTLVREVMTPLADTSVVSPDTPMIDVVQRMAVAVSGRIMVVQNGRLEGIISARDLAIWMDRASLVD
jgi:CBS domain-containing protein